jgi:hypothetical protein
VARSAVAMHEGKALHEAISAMAMGGVERRAALVIGAR